MHDRVTPVNWTWRWLAKQITCSIARIEAYAGAVQPLKRCVSHDDIERIRDRILGMNSDRPDRRLDNGMQSAIRRRRECSVIRKRHIQRGAVREPYRVDA